MTHQTDWIFWILIGNAAALASLHYFNPREFSVFSKAPFSNLSMSSPRSKGDYKTTTFNFTIELIFYLVSPLFLSYTLFGRDHLVFSGWIPYTRMLFVLVVLFLTQSAILHAISWIFQSKEGFTSFQKKKNNIRNWLSLVLIPLLFLGIFSPFGQLNLVVSAIGLIIGITYVSGVLMASSEIRRLENISVLHIILYLCTLEIGPLLVLMKIFIS